MILPSGNCEMDQKLKVYFDANALNFFCDEFRGKSRKPFRDYEIPLSWPLVDEIECNSSFARTIDLADFAWDVSNRKVFLTVRDLVALEIESLLANKVLSISNYFDSDQSYLIALNEARTGRTPNQTRNALRSAISEQKKRIQNWEQMQRGKWSSRFGPGKLLSNDWNEFSSLLFQERYFNEVLYGMVEAYDLSNRFGREDIMNLDHKSLPSLSIGIEFYVALQFLIDSQSKKLGRPDRGDLPDMQHTFYVALCDYFVTDDPRVRHILLTLIDKKSTSIISCNEFYHMITP